MAACEWCWNRAFIREMADSSKSQAEHYRDILVEQLALGVDAQCPEAVEVAKSLEALEEDQP